MKENIRHSLYTAIKASVMELKNVILASSKTRTKNWPLTLEDSRSYLEAQLRMNGALNINLKHLNSVLSHYDKLVHAATELAKLSVHCANSLNELNKTNTISLLEEKHKDEFEGFSERDISIISFSVYRFMNEALSRVDYAARVKDGTVDSTDVERFQKDADDAKSLLEKLDKLK